MERKVSEWDEKALPLMSRQLKMKKWQLFQKLPLKEESKVITFNVSASDFKTFEILAILNGFTWDEQARRLITCFNAKQITDTALPFPLPPGI